MQFSAAQGSVVEQSTDALVAAAGTDFYPDGGGTGVFRPTGGSKLDETPRENARIGTNADTNADVVVHDRAMPRDRDGQVSTGHDAVDPLDQNDATTGHLKG
jgi:hypothetical protein